MYIWRLLGILVGIVRNGHDDPCSNPRQGYLHFAQR